MGHSFSSFSSSEELHASTQTALWKRSSRACGDMSRAFPFPRNAEIIPEQSLAEAPAIDPHFGVAPQHNVLLISPRISSPVSLRRGGPPSRSRARSVKLRISKNLSRPMLFTGLKPFLLRMVLLVLVPVQVEGATFSSASFPSRR